jgi:hypothetical protein
MCERERKKGGKTERYCLCEIEIERERVKMKQEKREFVCVKE